MSNTPLKLLLKEKGDTCINCGCTSKDKRRAVSGDAIEIIKNVYRIDLVEEKQVLFFCKACFLIVRQFSAAKIKLVSSYTDLSVRGKDGPLQTSASFRIKRGRKDSPLPPKSNTVDKPGNIRTPKKRRKELFPKTPVKENTNKTCRVVVSIETVGLFLHWLQAWIFEKVLSYWSKHVLLQKVKTKYKSGTNRITHPKGIYKSAIKNLSIKRIKSAVKALGKSEEGRTAVIEFATNLLNEEATNICLVTSESFLRLNVRNLLEPSPYSNTLRELQVKCPYSFKVLSTMANKSKRGPALKELPRIATAWSLLMFNRNNRMNRLQTMYSLLLYKSCADTKVSFSK